MVENPKIKKPRMNKSGENQGTNLQQQNVHAVRHVLNPWVSVAKKVEDPILKKPRTNKSRENLRTNQQQQKVDTVQHVLNPGASVAKSVKDQTRESITQRSHQKTAALLKLEPRMRWGFVN